METIVTDTYEKIYFSLWETAQRYSHFAQFRVIGKSHDERMIPMLELGTGDTVLFCLSGFGAPDRQKPVYLARMAGEYCRAYESSWKIGELYDVQKLLDKVRICVIPLVNPDGYEVGLKGYGAIRNPVFRQMLRMQNTPVLEFSSNARGVDIRKNFPTSYYRRKRICQEPSSENETRALIRIFEEYQSRGLLSFCNAKRRIVYYHQSGDFSCNRKSHIMARHLQRCASCGLERRECTGGKSGALGEAFAGGRPDGSPEQFYAELLRQPALMIRTETPGKEEDAFLFSREEYEEIHTLPLEFIYTLTA